MSWAKKIQKILLCAFACVALTFVTTTMANAACSADQIDVTGNGSNCQTAKFSVGTTSISSGETFKFTMTAQGTFYVDCGDGGTLSSSANDVSGKTVTRSNTTEATYTCTYSTTGTKTIRFGGAVTGYSTSGKVAALSFSSNKGSASLVSGISGSLGALFPTLGQSNGQKPSFYDIFYNCTKITSIPTGFFNGVTAVANYGFAGTFQNTSITSIPSDLFGTVVGGSTYMFYYTFYGCTSLTTIPSGLFSGITTGATQMFYSTFSGCSSLTTIPSNLFSGITTGASSMFAYTFNGCTSLTTIPSNLFSGITTGASGMFQQTFTRCTSLTTIPSGLFSNITTGASQMFSNTFYGCSNLSGYIPPSTFAGLIANNHPTATDMWDNAFTNTQLATSCPTGTTQYITGYEGNIDDYTWNGRVSCISTTPMEITLNAAGADGDAVPSTVYLKYNTGWYSDSNTTNAINGLTTLPTKTGKVFGGFYTGQNATGTKVVDENGNFITKRVFYDTTTLYAYFGGTSYTVSYSCGDGTGTAPSNVMAVSGGQFVPAYGHVCSRNGYIFAGWAVSGTNDIVGTPFTWNYNGNKTLTAQWVETKFSIGTTSISSGETFIFKMSAQGTFYVDCGDGGILSGSANDVSGMTITRNNTNQAVYTCTYATAGAKTLHFSGTATNYNTSTSIAAIQFYITNTNAAKIKSVSGDMSAVFPYISANAASGAQPRFYYTFEGATNLTDISGTLFSQYTTGASYMFSNTFRDCTSLTTIPSGLFSGITTGADWMFFGTFQGCKSLTTIPSGLFSNITTGASYMFNGTFWGCKSLTTIPSGLFSNITTGASYMFQGTFMNCTSLTTIPSGLFSGITTGASGMFYGTFNSCTSLTTIPSGLFSNITTGATYMFNYTFSGCTNLSGYIPPSTFAGLIANGSPTAYSMWDSTFTSTKLATSCPDGLTQYITGYESYWYNKVSCNPPPTEPLEITLDSTGATTNVSPSTVYIKYNTGWYSDSNGTTSIAAVTAPTKTDYEFMGFYTGQNGTGVQVIDSAGQFITSSTVLKQFMSAATVYAYFKQWPAVTLSAPTADTGVSPSTVYLKYNTGWYADSAAATAISSVTVPTKTKSAFAGFFTEQNGAGTKIVDESGNLLTTSSVLTFTTEPVTLYAYFVGSYDVTYSCGTGTGTPPSTGAAATNLTFTPAGVGDCSNGDLVFAGWAVSGTNDVRAGAFTWTYDEDKTFTAQWVPSTFSVTTTNISANGTFKFRMSAQGTFNVYCGDGGTLSGADVSGNIITRNNTTEATYTCTYSTAGAKTLHFSGTATNYNTSTSIAAIRFHITNANAAKIKSVSGDMSIVFPYISANAADGAQPRFYYTFNKATNLTDISGTLFSQYTTGASYMFYQTFYNCTSLTTIPSGLFSNITTGASAMFQETFYGCTSLTTIPSGLFSNITTGASAMFQSTFYNCTSLTTIPSGLFSNITTGADFMFYNTFRGCTSLTTIPSNLFSGITTGANSMFYYTFYNCTSLTTIPSNLFSGITTGASYMFYRTFTNCTSLTTIPSNLFSGITTGATYMFQETFSYCTSLTTIPSGLFSNITTGANYMFSHTFYGCTSLTTIPSGLFSNITTGASGMFQQTFSHCTSLTTIPSNLFSGITTGADWMFGSTFNGCTSLTTIPSNLFSGITSGADYMFDSTFSGCTSLTTIPSNLFSGITTGASGMFQQTFSHCTSLTTIPSNLFSGITTGASNMFANTFWDCTSLTTIPSGLFSGITTGANEMFDGTFYGCTSLTTIPSNLFSGITTGASGMFASTFNGCSNLSGYIPPTTFAGLIANNHPTADYMWDGTFTDTRVATVCPNKYVQYITGYESYWDERVSCEPAPTYAITLNTAGATTNASPSTVYLNYSWGWYSDSGANTPIYAVGTVPTKTDYEFMGFYTEQNGAGTQITDGLGQFLTTPAALSFTQSNATVYAYFKQWPAVTLSASGANVSPSPSTVYLRYNTGWFTDAGATNEITSLTTNPTKDGTVFGGFYTGYNGTGTRIIDAAGNFMTTSNALTFTTLPATIYAYFGTGYTVTYSCGDGATGTPPSADIAVANLSFTPSGAGECAKSGSSFAGWAVSNSDDVRTGAFTWEYTENKTFTAQWNESSFSVTTVEIDDNATFSFHMSAAGIFTVDWGDGTSETLNRTNNTTNTKYSHTYATGGEYTISFAGTATGYSTSNTTGVLSFRDGTPKLVASVTGSLGDVFPTLGAANGLTPRFFGLFRGCTKLRWIPETLFSGVTGVAPYMFGDTFYGCTDLRNIPDGLFSGISGSAEGLFYETFYNCKELHSPIPGDLFAGIDGPARYMFYRTFYNTRNIQGYIPPSLFDGLHHGDAAYMMTSIFYNSDLATDCEEYDPDLRQFITGYEEYFDDRVSCFDGNALYEITLDSAGATTSAMPETVYIQYDNDWFADSNGNTTIGSLTRLPVRNNYTFGGFYTGPNGTGTQIVNSNGEFQYGQSELTAFGADGTIYAYWTPVPVVSAPTFAVTTTNLDAGDEFRFRMSAAGVFTVDWGDGTVETIDRTNNTDVEMYSHTYTTGGVKTIGFGGRATGYNEQADPSVIDFSEDYGATNLYVAGVSGSLGSLFPTLGNNVTQQPSFYNVFFACENLTSIPENLFDGVTGNREEMFEYTFGRTGITTIPAGLFSNITTGATQMFYSTFSGCTSLTTIPSGLFSNITTGASAMFQSTFSGCTSLTTIPSNLFSGITTGAGYMFYYTFYNCTSLTTIPSGLFSGITTGADHMFDGTFYGCTSLTTIPSNLFSGITSGATYMFQETFYGCTSLTTIPSNLFSGITTGANHMFSQTFSYCTSLTTIPSNLFSGITTGANYMFSGTFYGCTNLSGYIPPSTFAGLIANNHPTATNMWTGTFANTQLLTSCPSGTTQYTTGYESDWAGKVSCNPTTTLTITLDDGDANTSVAPGTVYLDFGTGWYSDAGATTSISTLTTVPSKSGYIFNGFWSGANGTGTQIIAPNGGFVASGSALTFTVNNATIYADWREQFSVSYSCGDGTGTAPTGTTVIYGTSFTPAANTCSKSGYIFTGWGVSDTNDTVNGAFTWRYSANKTLTAQFETAKFSVTTTNLSANTEFKFGMSAAGVFTVDWGDGTVETIDRTNNTEYELYSHTYTTAGVKTIGFTGTATGYNDPEDIFTPAIVFGSYDNGFIIEDLTEYFVDSISGSLGALFPTLGNGATQQPIFYGTFAHTNIRSIPSGLFDGVTGSTYHMFDGTFEGCENLESVPANLFSGVTGSAEIMFAYTFSGCTSLTTIPSDLFSGITTGAHEMFASTFFGCTSLTTIPSNLFSGITTGASHMFASTFYGCTKLTTIPSNLFSGITTGANYMFASTFYGCTKLTTIPSNLFSGITTGADDMFYYTFSGCTSLTTIPSNLFSGITTGAYSMFDGTFRDCTSLTTIPSNLFSGITTGANHMFSQTFSYCTSLTTIPSNLFSGITTGANYMFSGTFYGCTNLSGYIPPSTFAGLIANNHPTADHMWSGAFTNTQLATSCPSGTTQYITGYEGSGATTWNGKVSCTPTTTLTITLDDGDANTSVAPGTVYLDFGTGWYSDAGATTSISTLTTVPSKSGYIFNGFWSGANGTGTQIIAPNGGFVASGSALTFTVNNATIYADWRTPYTVNYSCGSGSGTAPANGTANFGATFTTAANTCSKSGYMFAGWAVSGTNDVVSGAFIWNYNSNKTLTAQFETAKFSVTTTNLDAGDEFRFGMSAAGVFTVDWGDGTVETINRTNNTEYELYSHTYTTAGVKTIKFAGTATGYNDPEDISTPAIAFGLYDNGFVIEDLTEYFVDSISGSLGALFPTLGNGATQQPIFYGTFAHTNIRSIPSGLFDGVTGSTYHMFDGTFSYCENLESVPANLFSGITTGANEMFYGTFDGCSSLTTIPSNLFSGITSGADYMFVGTFSHCTSLTTIPSGLFSNITTGATYMFYSTFGGCENISGYISPALFRGLINNGSPYESDMFEYTFYNTDLTDDCGNYGLSEYETGYEQYWDGHVACGNLYTTCPVGKFMHPDTGVCTACPIGSYNDGTVEEECIPCPWGTTTSGPGQSMCNAECHNNIGVLYYKRPEWDYDEYTVNNVCTISSCSGGYYPVINDTGNLCASCAETTGGTYTHSPTSGVSVYNLDEKYGGDGRRACFLYRSEINGSYIKNPGDMMASECPAGFYNNYPGIDPDEEEPDYNIVSGQAIHFGEAYDCEVCPINTYSIGGATQCTSCLQNYATFGERNSPASCRIMCAGGYYLKDANDLECTAVGAGNWAVSGFVSQGSVSTYQSCPVGLTNIGYGVGADEEGDCGRILHVGDNIMYLRTDRKTEHTLNVKVGNTIFYGNMAAADVNMSYGVNKSLKVRFNNTTYSVYDDSGETYIAEPEVSIQLDPNPAAKTIVPSQYNSASGMDWSAVMNDADQTELSGVGRCSTTTGANGAISAIDFEPNGNGTQCWCKITDPVEATRWVAATANTSCSEKCGYYCANNMKGSKAKNITYRTNLYSAAGILKQ